MGFIKHSKATSYIKTTDGNFMQLTDVDELSIFAIDDIDVFINNTYSFHLTKDSLKYIPSMRISMLQILPIGAKAVIGENCKLYMQGTTQTIDMLARNTANNAMSEIGTETYTEQNYIHNGETIKKSLDNIDSALDNLVTSMGNLGIIKKVELYQNFTPNGTTNYQVTNNNNGLIVDKDNNIIPFDITKVDATFGADISNLTGGVVYNSNNIFTRKRIEVVSFNSLGDVVLNDIPNQPFRIYFVYNLQPSNTMSNDYFRSDYLNKNEFSVGNVTANQVITDNTITGFNSTNLQDTLQELDLILDNHLADDTRHLTISENDAIDNANAPSSTNPFATMSDITGISGDVHPVVADNTALVNIPVSERIDKMLVPIDSNGFFYKYDANSTAVDDGVNIVQPFDGIGRYILFSKGTTAHDVLSGLQGGNGTEYYHLSQSDYNNRVTIDNAVAFKNKSIAVNGTDGNTITGLQQSDIQGLVTDLSNKVNTSALTDYAQKSVNNTFTADNNFTGALKHMNLDVIDTSTTQTLYNKTIKVSDGNTIEVNKANVNGLTTDLTNINNNITTIGTDLSNFEGNFTNLAGGTTGQVLMKNASGKYEPHNLNASGGFDYEIDTESVLSTITPLVNDTILIRNYNGTGKPNYGYYNGTSWIFASLNAINVYDEGVLKESNINSIDFVGSGVLTTKTATGKVRVTINSGSGGGSSAVQQIAQTGVVASTSAPYKIQIPISATTLDDGTMSPTIWKFIAGTTNVVTTIADFNSSESTNYQTDSNVLFDGKMHLKTTPSFNMNDDGILGTGKVFSISLDISDYKNVESLEVA